MKLINFITKNISRRDIYHRYQQRSSFSDSNFSEIFTNKFTPRIHYRFSSFNSQSGIHRKPLHSVYSSFVRKSYYSSSSSSSSSSSKNPKMGILSWYLSVLNSRPILTKSISAAVIYGAADWTSQVNFHLILLH